MAIDTAHIAVSGIHAAGVRLRNSAHNLANATTDEFHPLRTTQATEEGGGVRAETIRSEAPAEVSFASELVEQMRAEHQAMASLRVLATDARMRGALLDLKA